MTILLRTICVLSLALLLPACSNNKAPADYTNTDNWLCLPSNPGACDVDLSATIVTETAELIAEPWRPNPQAEIDCFYVYPTVSRDLARISDMNAGPEERAVVRTQAARFRSQCRVFAPLYRQLTLVGLRATMMVGEEPDMSFGYADVKAAWEEYLAHHNNGRGVVLIGHSQGAHVLTRLIAEEIEGKPIQHNLVSALLIGGFVQVPVGQLTGGSFESVELCSKGDQLGCVVAYSAFRSTIPPTQEALFGRSDAVSQTACVNPAILSGDEGRLISYLGTGASSTDAKAETPRWVSTGSQPATPYVSVPGLLSAQCQHNDYADYLEVSVLANPADPRVDDIAGDVVFSGEVQSQWGLHLVDIDVAMGNLLKIVEMQSAAYRHQ